MTAAQFRACMGRLFTSTDCSVLLEDGDTPAYGAGAGAPEGRRSERLKKRRAVDDEPTPGTSGEPSKKRKKNVPAVRRSSRLQRTSSSSSSSPDEDDGEDDGEDVARPHRKFSHSHPFAKTFVAYQDDNLRVIVKQAKHIHQKRFRLTDHLMDVKIEHLGTTEAPLLNSLLEMLGHTIETIVGRLQEWYGATENRQVYATVIEDKMVGGLRTGHFSLNTPKEEIAAGIVYRLYNYLKSAQDLRLNDSFRINFKILSVNHAAEKVGETRPYWPQFVPELYAGCQDDVLRVRLPQEKSFLFSVPNGFEDCPHAYTNRCVLASIAVALAWLDAQENRARKFLRYMELHRVDRQGKAVLKSQKRGGIALLDAMLQMGEQFPTVKHEGPHRLDLVLPTVSRTTGVQFHVFCRDTKKLIYSAPPEFDESMRQVYLYKSGDHIEVIKKPQLFFRLHGHFCFSCRKTFTTRAGQRHMCKIRKTCLACRFPFQKENTYVSRQNEHMLCDSVLKKGDEPLTTCQNCNLVCETKKCFYAHKRNCHVGWNCAVCQKYTYASGECQTHAEIERQHRCGAVKCRFCPEQLLQKERASHQCVLSAAKAQTRWNRLGFFQFQYVDASDGSCFTCKEGVVCNVHRETAGAKVAKIAYPNLCVLLTEEEERHKFKETFFFDFELPGQGEQKTKGVDLPYSPDQSDPLPFDNYPDKTRFGKIKRKPDKTRLLQEDSSFLSVEEQFLQYVLAQEMQNVTFITHGGSYGSLSPLASAMLKYNLKPEVIQSEQVMVVELQAFGLRFIDICNYIPLPEEALMANFGRTSYFPQKLNHPILYGQTKVPVLEDYLTFQDTPEVVKKKSDWFECNVKELQAWNCTTQLVENCHQKVLTIAEAAVFYVKESTHLQRSLQHMTSKALTTNELQFANPFNAPLCSKAAFIMYLFKWLSLPDQTIHTVRNEETGIGTNCSRGEYEWISYLQLEQPDKSFETAFSPHGQHYFKETVPDIYCQESKYAGFFNGCVFHGHTDAKCSIMKGAEANFRGQSCKKLEEQFNSKVDSLKDNHPEQVENVAVMWECKWNWMKKNDKNVMAFLKKLQKRPMKRAKPRDACKYSLLALASHAFPSIFLLPDRGGQIDTMRAKWLATEHPGETFYVDDKTSSYGSACLRHEYPVGPYQVCMHIIFLLALNENGTIFWSIIP